MLFGILGSSVCIFQFSCPAFLPKPSWCSVFPSHHQRLVNKKATRRKSHMLLNALIYIVYIHSCTTIAPGELKCSQWTWCRVKLCDSGSVWTRFFFFSSFLYWFHLVPLHSKETSGVFFCFFFARPGFFFFFLIVTHPKSVTNLPDLFATRFNPNNPLTYNSNLQSI